MKKSCHLNPEFSIRSVWEASAKVPTEDCGGIPGYYDLLQALRDPDYEEHGEMLEWAGSDFDPEAFSVDDINRSLASLQRHYQKTEGT